MLWWVTSRTSCSFVLVLIASRSGVVSCWTRANFSRKSDSVFPSLRRSCLNGLYYPCSITTLIIEGGRLLLTFETHPSGNGIVPTELCWTKDTGETFLAPRVIDKLTLDLISCPWSWQIRCYCIVTDFLEKLTALIKRFHSNTLYSVDVSRYTKSTT